MLTSLCKEIKLFIYFPQNLAQHLNQDATYRSNFFSEIFSLQALFTEENVYRIRPSTISRRGNLYYFVFRGLNYATSSGFHCSAVCSRQLLVGSSRVARVFRVLKQTRSRVTRVQHAHRVTCKYSQA